MTMNLRVLPLFFAIVVPLYANLFLEWPHTCEVPFSASHKSKSDPFDPVRTIQTGPFAGRVLNTKRKRPIEFLPRTSDLYELYGASLESDLLVANFIHGDSGKNEFWIAKIPLHSVRGISWIKNAFSVPSETDNIHYMLLAHSQLEFALSRPVELLVPQGGLNTHSKDYRLISQSRLHNPVKIWELSISFDAMFDFEEEPLSFLDSSLWVLRSIIPASIRMISKESREREMLVQYGGHSELSRSVARYTLNISQADMNKVFNFALHESHKLSANSLYHLFNNSCTSRSFSWLDEVLGTSPEHQYYIDYYTSLENIELFLEEILRHEKFIEVAATLLNNTKLKTFIINLKRDGVHETAKAIGSNREIAEMLINDNVLASLPSFIHHNLRLRGLLLE